MSTPNDLAAASPLAGDADLSDKSSPFRRFFAKAWVRAMLALIIIFVLGCIFNANGTFFRWTPHRDMLRQTSVYGILACGMTMAILTGGIDLGVGSVLAAVAVPYSLFLMVHEWSAWIVVPICLVIGTACGAWNGFLIGRFKFQPFIATLAMMTFARGLAKTMSSSRKIMNVSYNEDGSIIYKTVFPDLTNWLNARILGNNIAVVTIIMFACMLLTYIILNKLTWGRYVYSVGGNEEASRLSGVPVLWTKILAYGFSGFCCAIAGICQAAQEYQGDPEAGMGYELNAIGMVVIGGTSLAGGRGGIGLTIIGVLTMGYLDKILSLNAVEEASRLMLTAAIIVIAVLFQSSRRK
ncbi:MAG: ABC transporter permease [Planctomycetaceae bacterium]|nr:ABC transporter permease [Planctomycetaceae bacterium]